MSSQNIPEDASITTPATEVVIDETEDVPSPPNNEVIETETYHPDVKIRGRLAQVLVWAVAFFTGGIILTWALIPTRDVTSIGVVLGSFTTLTASVVGYYFNDHGSSN